MTTPGTREHAGPDDTSRCPSCGTGLRCGMVAGDSQCWCFALPHVIPVPSDNKQDLAASAGCLCPACLQRLIDSHEPNTHA
ncbi:MAG: cysteine-rich CWC family protein [Pseudomonadota bacterium]